MDQSGLKQIQHCYHFLKKIVLHYVIIRTVFSIRFLFNVIKPKFVFDQPKTKIYIPLLSFYCCFPNSESKEARRGEKAKEGGLHASTAHDSSYYEVPTKESHMANNGIHEIPTKDTEDGPSPSHIAACNITFFILFLSDFLFNR